MFIVSHERIINTLAGIDLVIAMKITFFLTKPICMIKNPQILLFYYWKTRKMRAVTRVLWYI